MLKLLIIIIAILGLGGAQISAIGVTLYDWSHDLALSTSAWHGFIVWVKMMAIGVIAIITSSFMDD